jgi:Xaa-Pro dipeptidase
VKSVLYKKRTEKLVEVLKSKGIDGFIFGISVSMYYFTNFYEEQGERFLALLVPSKGDPVFLVPELYYDQICETTWIESVVSWSDGKDPFEKMASIIEEKKLSNAKIAIDDTLRGNFLLSLQERLPQVKFTSGGKFVDILRRVKSDEEKDLMMHAGSIHEKVFKKAISEIKIGISELKIADLIINTFKEFGAKCTSIVPIVGSGPYSAQPHYRATDKIIANEESVILDCCGDWKHYKSDMTRTVFVGKPSQEYLKVYDIVRKAQETGLKSVKSGRTCEEIDQIVRKIIEDEGYGKYFIHRTGHGLGLLVHEDPYIVEGNKLVLEPGMTFSIEPGIYLPEKFGIRIEDCVIVTENGAEPFTTLTHDLITI